jgi:hypothetical protein
MLLMNEVPWAEFLFIKPSKLNERHLSSLQETRPEEKAGLQSGAGRVFPREYDHERNTLKSIYCLRSRNLRSDAITASTKDTRSARYCGGAPISCPMRGSGRPKDL